MPAGGGGRVGSRATERTVEKTADQGLRITAFSGHAVAAHVVGAIDHFRDALATGKRMIIDVSKVQHIDARFFGLFLMIRKQLAQRGQTLVFAGASARQRRIFRLNRFEFLLPPEV